MALMNVQLKDLTSAIHRIGQHPFDVGNHADIWLGEFIDPKQRTHKVRSLTRSLAGSSLTSPGSRSPSKLFGVLSLKKK